MRLYRSNGEAGGTLRPARWVIGKRPSGTLGKRIGEAGSRKTAGNVRQTRRCLPEGESGLARATQPRDVAQPRWAADHLGRAMSLERIRAAKDRSIVALLGRSSQATDKVGQALDRVEIIGNHFLWVSRYTDPFPRNTKTPAATVSLSCRHHRGRRTAGLVCRRGVIRVAQTSPSLMATVNTASGKTRVQSSQS